MKAYCGQTRSAALVAQLEAEGIGECTVRGELKSRRRDPWFYDNGAYRDWTAGKAFNAIQFTRDMRRIRYSAGSDATPDFVVLPDLVARGVESLAFSTEWWHDVEGLHCYLAVQNGMTVDDVRGWIRMQRDLLCEVYPTTKIAGLFVGGTMDWKIETALDWIRLAHEHGMWCHVGRVGTPDRVRWARDIGADSIDSCLPLMFAKHLERFLGALA